MHPPTGHFVGAMPPDQFLEDFMSPTEVSSTAAPYVDFSKVILKGQVSDMCKALIQAITTSKACPGVRLFRTRPRKQQKIQDAVPSNDGTSNYTDYDVAEADEKSSFSYGQFPALAARKQPLPRKKTRKIDIVETYDYATVVLDIEVHTSSEADPFADPGDETTPQSPSSPSTTHSQPQPSKLISQLFENPSPAGAAFRESLAAHAASQLTRRHRVFFLQLVIFDRWARFIRWDRSGAISTERFDYVAQPSILSRFFWRFAHLTDEQRGLDPTVTAANAKEKKLIKAALHDFVKTMKTGVSHGVPTRTLPNAERLVEDTKEWPVWKVHVADATGEKSTEIIVRRPLSDSCRAFGRATRGYIAYDLKEQRLVFLKDTWRLDHPQLLVESQTYENLKMHHIPHIPNVLYGGDVQSTGKVVQETLTQAYAEVEDEWRIVTSSSYDRYIHHRIVQDIAYPIESALHVVEFVQVLHDVLEAIMEAHDKAGLLHRDLSLGNVMIDSNGRGILNDWDHAGSKHQPARGIGTWRFMSVPLLINPRKLHGIADDLESLFWVLLLGSMQLFAEPDQRIPFDVFDWQGSDWVGHRIGGRPKRDWLREDRIHSLNGLGFEVTTLYHLIMDSRSIWTLFYSVMEADIQFGRHQDEVLRATWARDAFNTASSPAFWLSKYAKVLKSMNDTRVWVANNDLPESFLDGLPPLEGHLGQTLAPAPVSTTPDMPGGSQSPFPTRRRQIAAVTEYEAPFTRSKKRRLGL